MPMYRSAGCTSSEVMLPHAWRLTSITVALASTLTGFGPALPSKSRRRKCVPAASVLPVKVSLVLSVLPPPGPDSKASKYHHQGCQVPKVNSGQLGGAYVPGE